jgi:fructokinase
MILCCGEALIDFVPTVDGAGYRPVPGGSIFNIALGLGRLGAPVGYLGKLSTDFFGDRLLQTLSQNGVDTSLVRRAPGPTTLAFVDLFIGGSREPSYTFYAESAVDRSLAIGELPKQLAASVQALHFGSISLLLEPGASSLEALMRRETGQRLISLDPNVRPGLIQDRDAYRERFEGWTEVVDVLRLSRADFDWLYPNRSWEAAFQDWFSRGVSLVILTNGAQGALGMTAEGASAFSPAAAVEVVDTVGAGDSFLAACLFFLAREGTLASKEALRRMPAGPIERCLVFASRAAALTCSRAGSDPPFLRELEPERSR